METTDGHIQDMFRLVGAEHDGGELLRTLMFEARKEGGRRGG